MARLIAEREGGLTIVTNSALGCLELGRNSDNTRLRKVLNWEPKIPLEEGLEITYRWIAAQLAREGSARVAAS